MPEDKKPGNVEDGNEDRPPSTGSFPLKSGGEVVVTHLDAPPPAGKKTIHPRRVAPIVPTRKERKPQTAPSDPSQK
jgi:hypothetical protein